jgi:hypothetical protein
LSFHGQINPIIAIESFMSSENSFGTVDGSKRPAKTSTSTDELEINIRKSAVDNSN